MDKPEEVTQQPAANDVATVWPSREKRKEDAVETPPAEPADKEEPAVEQPVDGGEPPQQEWQADERDEQIRILTAQLTSMATQMKQLQEAQQKSALQPQQKQYLDASKLDLTGALENPAEFVSMLNAAIVQAVSDASELSRQGFRTEMPGFVRAQIEQDRVARGREAQFYEKHKDLFMVDGTGKPVPAPVAAQRKTLATQIMNGLYAQNAAYYDTLGEKAWDILAIDTGKALRDALNAPPAAQPRNSRTAEKRSDPTRMFPPAGTRPDHKQTPPTNTKADEIEATLTKGRHYRASQFTR